MSIFNTEQVLVPSDQSIDQLFIVLKDRHLSQDEKQAFTFLLDELKKNFPQSAIAIVNSDLHPSQESALNSDTNRLLEFLEVFNEWAEYVIKLQKAINVSALSTAVISYGYLGSLILEMSKLDNLIAGRLVVFGSGFKAYPDTKLQLKQTIHLLHAQDDSKWDVLSGQKAHHAILNAEGDCTLDIQAKIKESFSTDLVAKLIVRLKTCIPLWILEEVNQSQSDETLKQASVDTSNQTKH